jgi:hypothetical protein
MLLLSLANNAITELSVPTADVDLRGQRFSGVSAARVTIFAFKRSHVAADAFGQQEE